MARFQQIRDRLPSLYRPEDGDSSLVTAYLKAIGAVLEQISDDANDVLQSHWFAYADRALYSPFFLRSRQLQNLPFPKPNDPSLQTFPYIHDLAYLAGVLPLPPWQEPPAQRELVEAYRQRIRRTVDLYREGLGTVSALRRMIEAQLPVDLSLPPAQQDLPFWLEEFAPLTPRSLAVQMPGPSTDLVGPLMRWSMTNDGLANAVPTIYIQGVEPQADLIDATQTPLIELYQQGDRLIRLGIAYQDTIPPNQTLRLSPVYTSWISLDDHIQQSLFSSTDPTAPGPWQMMEDAPLGEAIAFVQSQDNMLWVAINADGAGSVWRYDGHIWTEVHSSLPPVHCLAVWEYTLLIGTDTGLLSMLLYPDTLMEETFDTTPVTALDGRAVFALLETADQHWWIGTDQGAAQLVVPKGESIANATLDPSPLQGTPVYAIHEDTSSTLYFGGELGLFQHQPGLNDWYWYSGESRTEDALDWQILGDTLPVANQVFLPPVHSIQRGADTSLWLGTARGIARYTARAIRGSTYETILEAFPDLTLGAISSIQEDERGLVWFAGDRGLLRYDGRDLWQYQTDRWVPLGQADTLYGDTPAPREAWRFNRTTSQWQQFSVQSATWLTPAIALRTTEEPAVHKIFWMSRVDANLGTWDGTTFTPGTVVDPSLLQMRFKPNEQRIVNGGIPAIPRLPVSSSTWRYLSMEPGETDFGTGPLWTIEGRLIPPPTDLPAPAPGRYDIATPRPASDFAASQFDSETLNLDKAIFAFNPAAKVWFTWKAKQPCTILARLKSRSNTPPLDPLILKRVQQGIQQVRPAGILTALAVEEESQ